MRASADSGRETRALEAFQELTDTVVPTWTPKN